MALTITESNAVNVVLDRFAARPHREVRPLPTDDEVRVALAVLARGAYGRLHAGWTPEQVHTARLAVPPADPPRLGGVVTAGALSQSARAALHVIAAAGDAGVRVWGSRAVDGTVDRIDVDELERAGLATTAFATDPIRGCGTYAWVTANGLDEAPTSREAEAAFRAMHPRAAS